MASVWKAEDTLLGRPVALKLLDEMLARDPQARRRFLREARNGAALDHPSIVRVYDVGESDGAVYFTLACIEGRTLSAHAARGPLEVSEVARIGIAAGEALAHAHARGMLHRDVTGRNIMITDGGDVVVLDFGLALALDQSRLTPRETALGTVGYMAPEVALLKPADERSDVYGLGVVLYELVTGTLPLLADRREAAYYISLNTAPEPPSRRRPDLPAELERIVLRAMAWDAGRRHPTMRDLVADLRGFLSARAPAHDPDGAAARAPAFESAPTDAMGTLPSPLFLAVLPFVAAEADGASSDEGGRIALGLSDALAVALGRLEGIHVIPPAAVAGQPADDLRRLARHLGANLLVRGSIRIAGGNLRVSYVLHHPYRGVQIAARTLEGTRGGLFLVEDELVADVLRHLGGAGVGGVPARRLPPDPAARERFLQALGDLQRFDHEASVDGAIRTLEDLAEGDPDQASYHATLGRAYLAKYRATVDGAWENRAASACHRALSLAPGSPDVLESLGELHLAAGRYPEAIAGFEAVLAVRPDGAGAHRNLARALRAAGRWVEAERSCRRALALQPDYWAHHNELGLILFHQGRFPEAAEAWRQVTRLSPDNAMGYWNLAGALFRQDRLGESVDMYRRSIEIRPTSRAYSSMGTALYWLGRHEEALEALRTCVALGPRDPLAWGTLGSACRWTPGFEDRAPEALDRAIALMREQLERDPGRAEDWANLASWLANRGLEQEAARAIERAIALPSFDVNGMAIAGGVCHVLGRKEEALRWFRKAVALGYGVTRLERNPALEGLREDPEFRSILAGAHPTSGDGGPRLPPNGGAR